MELTSRIAYHQGSSAFRDAQVQLDKLRNLTIVSVVPIQGDVHILRVIIVL